MGGNFMSDEKRHYIKFMYKYLNLDERAIKDHISIRNENGTKPRLSTVRYWINRLEETGDVQTISKPGRPRKLDQLEENRLIQNIKKFPKKRYTFIRRLGFIHIDRSTVNRYALRNKLSKNLYNIYALKNFIHLFI